LHQRGENSGCEFGGAILGERSGAEVKRTPFTFFSHSRYKRRGWTRQRGPRGRRVRRDAVISQVRAPAPPYSAFLRSRRGSSWEILSLRGTLPVFRVCAPGIVPGTWIGRSNTSEIGVARAIVPPSLTLERRLSMTRWFARCRWFRQKELI